MQIIGFAILGVIIFSIFIFAILLGGAFGHKQTRELREHTERQRAAGLTGDTTMNDPYASDYEERHLHA